MTNELKFSSLWANLKVFLNKTKINEREAYHKVLNVAGHDTMQSREFQTMYVETAVALFLKSPRVFDYTEEESQRVRLMINEQGRAKFAKSVSQLLQGQYNQNGTFFGKQAEFKWKRAPMQSGLAAIASSNGTRPWFCTVTHLPGYAVRGDGATIGGLFNHNWGFVDAKNEWYATYFSHEKTLRMIRTWQAEDVKQAQRHFEKLYLSIVFGDKHLDFRKRIFENSGEYSSLTI